MKAFKVIGNIVFVLLVIVFTFVCGLWLYLKVNNKFPQSVTTTYVNTITDQNGEEQPFLQINYCANANGSGSQMYEMKFSYYTDVNKSAVKSWGIQEVAGQTYYYDSFDGTSWGAVQNLEWGEPMMIEIDDELYSVTLEGKKTVTVDKGVTWGSFWNGLGQTWANILNGEPYIEDNHVYEQMQVPYTFDELLAAFKNTVVKSSKGYGEYVLPLVNLSEFFTIRRYDTEKKLFVNLDYTNFNFNYFGIEVSTTGSGVLYAKQSVFDMVANDFEYNKSGVGSGEYWQNAFIHTTLVADFELVGNDTDGFYLTLPSAKLMELNGYEGVKHNVKIDLNADIFKGKKILGLYDYALFGLKVNKLEIIGAGYQPFEIKSHALWDTELKTFLKSGIELFVSENAFNGGIEL